jgi:hypothetical protein
MENILFLGCRYPISADFLPNLTRAWLEGDEYFTAVASEALLNMGPGALPELLNLLWSEDAARVYAALSLLLESGGVPLGRLERLVMSDESYSSDALDVAMVHHPSSSLALDVLRNQGLSAGLRARALWWLALGGNLPEISEVLPLCESHSISTARDAGLVIQAFYGWPGTNGAPMDAHSAQVLASLGNYEAVRRLIAGPWDEGAQEVVSAFASASLGPQAEFVHEWAITARVRFPGYGTAVSDKLAELAELLYLGGQIQRSADALGLSLSFAWERKAADLLAELLALNPGMDDSAYLQQYRRWNAAAPLRISGYHHAFARALRGDLSAYGDCCQRPRGESLFSIERSPFTTRIAW